MVAMENSFDVNPAYEKWRLNQTDENLAELAKKLDRFAKAIIYPRINDPEFGGELDGVANDIVWKAIRQIDSFKGEAQFSTWFYKIALNTCNRFLRQYKQRRETALEDNVAARPSKAEARLDMEALLGKIEGEDQVLLTLRMEGRDFNAIARVLGIKRNAALQRWNRLKTRLRDALL